MKKEAFLQKIKKATSFIDSRRMYHLLNKSIRIGNKYHTFGSGSINLVIAMEELSELQKEVSKWLRGKGDRVNLTEEIADVTIMLEYLKIIAGIDQADINKAINVKLDRLEERDKEFDE